MAPPLPKDPMEQHLEHRTRPTRTEQVPHRRNRGIPLSPHQAAIPTARPHRPNLVRLVVLTLALHPHSSLTRERRGRRLLLPLTAQHPRSLGQRSRQQVSADGRECRDKRNNDR